MSPDIFFGHILRATYVAGHIFFEERPALPENMCTDIFGVQNMLSVIFLATLRTSRFGIMSPDIFCEQNISAAVSLGKISQLTYFGCKICFKHVPKYVAADPQKYVSNMFTPSSVSGAVPRTCPRASGRGRRGEVGAEQLRARLLRRGLLPEGAGGRRGLRCQDLCLRLRSWL